MRKSLAESSGRQPKPPQSSRVIVKKQKPQTEPVKRTKKVVVAKVAPPDAELKPIDYTGPSGPKFNEETGEIIAYTLLGSVEEFVSEAIKQNYMEPDSRASVVASPIPTEIPVRPSKSEIPPKQPSIKLSMNQENALLHWQRKMAERKRQQGYISKLLQKPIDRLVMQKDYDYRKVQEKRMLIDHAIPAMDYGKGYRVGSEFWKQSEVIGGEERGIMNTLTKTERGEPVVFEHVGKSANLRRETGLLDSKMDEVTENPGRTWNQSEYLKQRWYQLEPVMETLDPIKPRMKELQVIGQNYGNINITENNRESPDEDTGHMVQQKYDVREQDCNDPLEKFPDVFPQQVIGPSIIFGEHLASWTGSSKEYSDEIGHVARVFFETTEKGRTTSHLKVENNGTTCIYYDWRKVITPPAFESIKRDNMQRFYFNTGEGAILPGETKYFPFVFKSPNPGIVTETWQFLTQPSVLGGASLQVALKGVAVEDDSNVESKKNILKGITAKEAQVTAKSIIDEIINSIRERDRPPSPVDAYVTEEESFKQLNPSSQYDYETVLELKNFYLQLFPEETRAEHEWSLALPELKECICAIPDENAREDMLNGLGTVVSRLTSKRLTPIQNSMYSACYRILQESLDGMCSCSMRIRASMGLPEVVMESVAEGETSATAAAPPPVDTKAEDKKAKGAKKPAAKEDPKAKGKGKKDAKEKERPKSKGKAKAMSATPTREAHPSERDLLVKTPSSTKQPPVDTLDRETRKKYTEKMYSQVYNMLCDAFDDIGSIFLQIQEDAQRDEK